MSRKHVAVAALGAFALLLSSLGSSANACILGWGNSNGWGNRTSHRNHCYQPRRYRCHAPAPTCCKPTPTCCKPAPTCSKPKPARHGAAKPLKKVEEAPAPPPEKAPKAAPKKKAPAPPAPKKPAPKKPAAKKKEA